MDQLEHLEYNTERSPLHIPEYGRHFQKMVDYAVSLSDRDERNKAAQAIISVMGNLQPQYRDVADFQHMLWDQLFIMSDLKLDAESPFDKPTEEQLNLRPEPLNYPQNFPKYRFYGNNIKTMIDVANTWEAGEMKDALQYTIANHMKKSFLNWNKDTVEDVVIYGHLFELSDGKIDLRNSKEELSEVSSLLKVQRKFSSQKKSTKKNNQQRNRKRY